MKWPLVWRKTLDDVIALDIHKIVEVTESYQRFLATSNEKVAELAAENKRLRADLIEERNQVSILKGQLVAKEHAARARKKPTDG